MTATVPLRWASCVIHYGPELKCITRIWHPAARRALGSFNKFRSLLKPWLCFTSDCLVLQTCSRCVLAMCVHRCTSPRGSASSCVMTMCALAGAHLPGEQPSVERGVREEPDSGRGHRCSNCYRGEAKGDAESLAANLSSLNQHCLKQLSGRNHRRSAASEAFKSQEASGCSSRQVAAER